MDEKPFNCTMCGKSFSESGYWKRNLTGPTQERKHFSAPNVTGEFRKLRERNNLGAPKVTTASLKVKSLKKS